MSKLASLVHYKRSALTGADQHQALAKGFPIGKRFHSAPVIRLADAKPMKLGHVVEADARWRFFAFAPAGDTGQKGGAIATLCDFLTSFAASPTIVTRGRVKRSMR